MTPAQFKAARHKLGLTGAKLAQWLGVNPRTVRKWEQPGKKVPKYAAQCVGWFLAGFNPDTYGGDDE